MFNFQIQITLTKIRITYLPQGNLSEHFAVKIRPIYEGNEDKMSGSLVSARVAADRVANC